jgi:hypothetical protein
MRPGTHSPLRGSKPVRLVIENDQSRTRGIEEELQARLVAGAGGAGVPLVDYVVQVLEEHVPA